MRQTTQSATSRRQRAQRRGRFAEWICLWHLRLHGWRILAHGWRCPSGEIDILARRRQVIAVIVVKSRGELGAAAVALAPRQRRRIARAGAAGEVSEPQGDICRSTERVEHTEGIDELQPMHRVEVV